MINTSSPKGFIGSWLFCLSAAAITAGAAQAQTTIDFEIAAACQFSQSIPLGQEYLALGVDFTGASAVDGPSVMGICGGFGLTPHSGTSFLAGSTIFPNSLGGSTDGPVTMDFSGLLASASFFGSAGGLLPAELTMQAFRGGELMATDVVSIPAGNNWTELSISGLTGGFDRVLVIESSGSLFFFMDDLTFTPMPTGFASYCFGDGTGTTCPCGNVGSAGAGCSNSLGAGATCSTAGSLSANADDMVVNADGLIPGQAALLFSGTTQNNGGLGSSFGDGLLCVSGAIQRISVRIPNGSGQASWGPGLISGQGWTAGETRTLQVWYRNTTGGPCGSGFNLSNGLVGSFVP